VQCDIHDDKPGSLCSDKRVFILSRARNRGQLLTGILSHGTRQVEAKFGFYIHLSVYIAVSILLIIINLSTSAEYFWFKWPIIGWGIGVFFHALGVFASSGGSTIKDRMLEKEMEKEALTKQ
jgi:hypothetical protein